MNTRYNYIALAVAPLMLITGCNNSPRYQLISANANGIVFKIDTTSGNVWQIIPNGEETLVTPPIGLSFDQLNQLHSQLMKNDPKTNPDLREWAIEMKKTMGGGLYDEAILQSR